MTAKKPPVISATVPWSVALEHVPNAKDILRTMRLARFCAGGRIVPFEPSVARLDVSSDPEPTATLSIGMASATIDATAAWRAIGSFVSASDAPGILVRAEPGRFRTIERRSGNFGWREDGQGFEELRDEATQGRINRLEEMIGKTPILKDGRNQYRSKLVYELKEHALKSARFPGSAAHVWIETGLETDWIAWVRGRVAAQYDALLRSEETAMDKILAHQRACEHAFTTENSQGFGDEGGYYLHCTKCRLSLHGPLRGNDPSLPAPCGERHGKTVVYHGYMDYHHCFRCGHPVPAPS